MYLHDYYTVCLLLCHTVWLLLCHTVYLLCRSAVHETESHKEEKYSGLGSHTPIYKLDYPVYKLLFDISSSCCWFESVSSCKFQCINGSMVIQVVNFRVHVIYVYVTARSLNILNSISKEGLLYFYSSCESKSNVQSFGIWVIQAFKIQLELIEDCLMLGHAIFHKLYIHKTKLWFLTLATSLFSCMYYFLQINNPVDLWDLRWIKKNYKPHTVASSFFNI